VLSIYLFAICSPFRNFHSGHLPLLKYIYFYAIDYMSSLYNVVINSLSDCGWLLFSSTFRDVSVLLIISFALYMFLICGSTCFFAFLAYSFGVLAKNYGQYQCQGAFPFFFSKNFMFSDLTVKSLIYFLFIV
jgi:hypothetical protein